MWRIVATAGLVLITAVLLLPTLLSTPVGTAWALSQVNRRIPGRVSAESMTLAWWGGQKLEGLTLTGDDSETVATLETLQLPERGLVSLGWDRLTGSGPDLGPVRVEGGQVTLRRDAVGRMNLDRALGTRWFGGPGDGQEEAEPVVSVAEGGVIRRVSFAEASNAADEAAMPPGLSVQLVVRELEVAWRRGGASTAGGGEIARFDGERVVAWVPEATLTVHGPTRLGLTLEADVTRHRGGVAEAVTDRGTVEVAAHVERLFDEAGRWTLPRSRYEVDGRIEDLPVSAIDRLVGEADRWSSVLGPTLNAAWSVRGPVDELSARVVADSSRLRIRQTLRLGRDGVRGVSVPTGAAGESFTAAGADDVSITGDGAAAESEGLTLEITPASWAALLSAKRGFGSSAEASGVASGKPAPEGAGVRLLEPFRLRATVQELRAPAASEGLGADDSGVAGVGGMGPVGGVGLDLSATSYRLVLEPVGEDRVVVDWAGRPTLALTPRFVLSSDRADREAELGLVCGLTAGAERQELRAGVRVEMGGAVGGAALPGGAEGFTSTAAMGDGGVRVVGGVSRLPVGLLDWAGEQGDRLVATLGESLAVGVEALADGEGGYGLTVDFGHGEAGQDVPGQSSAVGTEPRMGPRLTGRMTGGYRDGAVTLRTDDRLGLWVSPEAFAQWMRPVAEVASLGESVGLSLPEAAELSADVDLSVAWRESSGLRFDPDRTRLRAAVRLPDTTLVDEWYDRRFALREGQVTIEADDLRQPIRMRARLMTRGSGGSGSASGEGGRVGAGGADEGGELAAEVRLSGAMLDDGYVQLERGRVTAEVRLDRLPTVIFDTLTRQRGYAVAAFGEKLDASVDVSDWSYAGGGAVAFELQSQNGSLASFSGRDEAGRFVPDRPMTFYFNQTPALAGKIMRWVNPVLLPAVRSATVPFTLTIDDDSFRLPTRGFSFADLDADVQVQMGTVRIDPSIAPVNRIVAPLQRLNVLKEQLSYEARVSPIALRLRDGVLSYDTLRFRIDDVDLSFGGTVSLVDQVVDMRLNLGGREIERDPLLQTLAAGGIAIGGTVSDPKVNLETLLGGLRKERLPETVGGILGGLLKRELEKQQEQAEPESPPQR